ncbi:MAG: DeoR/GlpR family DNA-binding transcription regulator [Streptosporangiaceae bacterium]
MAERHRRVLELVRTRGIVSMREISQAVDASEVTIRRDLRLLATRGLIRRTHGGAAVPGALAHEPSYSEKARQSAAEKAAIAQGAVRMIKNGDALALGAGTTTLDLARLLVSYAELSVITDSLLVCQTLAEVPGISVLATGGEVRGSTRAFVGPHAERALDGLHVSTLFISGNGLTAERGLSTPDTLQAAIDRRLASTAEQIVVLTDHTKVGVDTMHQTIPVTDIDTVITDSRAASEEVRGLERAGVVVTVVDAACEHRD